MSFEVYAAHPSEFQWLVDRTGVALTSDARGIKAVDASGRIQGMVLYCSWTANAVTGHVAIDSPIAARALREPAFKYPFEEAGRRIFLGFIASSNKRSMSLALSLGFHEVHRVTDGFKDGADLVVMELRKETWDRIRQRRRRTREDSILTARVE